MRDWGSELEEMGFENGEAVPITPSSEPSHDTALDELEPQTRRAVELFAQISAIGRGLEMARTAVLYVVGDFNATFPASMAGNLPELAEIADRAAEEQTRLLAAEIFRRLLAQIPEDAPPVLRKQVDLFDTTFGLGLNDGRTNSEIATQRYGISREAWEQAQDRLCKSLGIARPITRYSKQDTTKNKLRNHRHVRFDSRPCRA